MIHFLHAAYGAMLGWLAWRLLPRYISRRQPKGNKPPHADVLK